MKAGDLAKARDRYAATRDMPLDEVAANCRWLSGMCDGAVSRDGAGWSRWDREMGCRLGALPPRKWSPVDLDHGRRLSHKYRRQLAERPPLKKLLQMQRAAMIGRLNGTTDVEVIDADTLPPVESMMTDRDKLRAAMKRIAAGEDVAEVAADTGINVHQSRRGTDETVPIRATGDRGERLPASGQRARRQSGAAIPVGVDRRDVDGNENGNWVSEPRTSGKVVDGGRIRLDASQRAALDLTRTHPVAVLTGGPGTGKTTIAKQVVADALADRHRVAAMAPTGIAAKRLSEAIGYPASTIHRALGAVPSGSGLITVQPDALAATGAADLVVVDEMSMVDVDLFAALLKALGRRARLLLIGDPDQLAPVGDGQPFTDLIEAGTIPVARLTTVHRQREGSLILDACDLIRQGRWYDAAPQVSRDADLVWIEEESEERLADLCEEVLASTRERFDAAEVSLLTPRVTGGSGDVVLRTEELNRRLQKRINPSATLGGGIVAGDPVVCTRNRPDDDVWNGTSGTAVQHRGILQLRTHEAEPRTVDCIEDCELAYALSVHRYQGSQNRVVIVAAHPSGGRTLTRRLLYTAVSRAQERCILLGPREAFEAAVAEATTRRTLLRELLDREGEGQQTVQDSQACESSVSPSPARSTQPKPSADVSALLESIKAVQRGGGLHPDADPFARAEETRGPSPRGGGIAIGRRSDKVVAAIGGKK